MKENLSYFNLDLTDWTVCLMGDNYQTNLKIAKLIGCPHVGCNNHKLSLEVNAMFENDAELKRITESFSETMTTAKAKLKNVTMLRNLTDLVPLLQCKTRWSGTCRLMKRFTLIRDELMEVSNSPDFHLPMNKRSTFGEKAKAYCTMLSEINFVTSEMQSKGHTVAACRAALDDLIQYVSDTKSDRSSEMFNCNLGTKYISTDANIVYNSVFESGVVKLQNGMEYQLCDDEKVALKLLVIDDNNSNSTDTTNENHHDNTNSIKLRLAKRRKICNLHI